MHFQHVQYTKPITPFQAQSGHCLFEEISQTSKISLLPISVTKSFDSWLKWLISSDFSKSFSNMFLFGWLPNCSINRRTVRGWLSAKMPNSSFAGSAQCNSPRTNPHGRWRWRSGEWNGRWERRWRVQSGESKRDQNKHCAWSMDDMMRTTILSQCHVRRWNVCWWNTRKCDVWECSVHTNFVSSICSNLFNSGMWNAGGFANQHKWSLPQGYHCADELQISRSSDFPDSENQYILLRECCEHIPHKCHARWHVWLHICFCEVLPLFACKPLYRYKVSWYMWHERVIASYRVW